MNKQELENKIEAFEKELALLKLEHFSKEKRSIWKPENNEKFFYIGEHGKVMSENFDGFPCENSIIDFGNHFKTEEEAEKQANYQKYTNLLRKYVEEHSGPLDWEDAGQDKICLYYDCETNRIEMDYWRVRKYQGVIYASSEEVLRDAIEFVGEENIKKYIFGVED